METESVSGCSRIWERDMASLRINEEQSALSADVQVPGRHPLCWVGLTHLLEFSDLGFQGTG